MFLNMYSIHDSAVGAFMRPFVAQSDGAALRQFSDLVNDEKHPIGEHPEDYALFAVGAFDEQTGHLVPSEPTSMGHALSMHGAQLPLKAVGDA